MPTMRMEINETRHVFRVNGVAIAKRHLVASFPDACCDDQRLQKYLVIVPPLASMPVLKEQKGLAESKFYLTRKARRVAERLEIDEENRIPFMMAMAQLAESHGEPSPSFQEPGRDNDNVIPFPVKATLH